jgi:PPE-repeat protein
MASTEGLNPNATREELQDEMVFTRILMETLDPEAYDYEELMAQHTAKMEELEMRLGISGSQSYASQSQAASQGSFNNMATPPEMASDLEDMLSPVASFNMGHGVDMAGTTGEFFYLVFKLQRG